jgi:hypothetical protein
MINLSTPGVDIPRASPYPIDERGLFAPVEVIYLLLSWDELHTKTYPKPSFLLDPFVTRGGITLLWGATSTGKSPTTWEMAAAIASGKSFFGLPTQKARVLYLEVDTPEQVVQERIKARQPSSNVWWLFSQPLSIPYASPEQIELLVEASEAANPEVVFINTLRKVHDLDDKESKAPKLVYSFFQKYFPTSALVFVHHTRKAPTDPRAIAQDKESFSGSNHWLDDAQVGLHLEKYDAPGGDHNLRLYHRKSQVSALLKPIPLSLGDDGSTLTSPLFEQLSTVYEWLASGKGEGMPAAEQDFRLGKLLEVSETTARRLRLHIEHGRFPGRGFLEERRDQ